MKWRVEGADRETGEDFAIEVEAPNESEARARASQRGMVVASAIASVAPLASEKVYVCPECKARVSRIAAKCPQCGHPLQTFSFARAILLFVIIVVVFWFLAMRNRVVVF